ncbi:AraC family transcriptional regulator [Litchfieldella qijiaojingensis]|uniref:AraC family transcriptional regulator n=1 Tax=Litchfieldella qijiaojingensis TaxID=980347 RepID=A0ABQ2Z4K6_9GAMM|nr:AraC family transcriptional regulator [Halomonas qijiaojingensis]GGY04865.1 AraC family transcriptional regulator [Halomonas qijiaojingensis]
MSSHHDRASGSPATASDVSAADDPLSDVLETVRLRGALFFQWQPFWPFASGVPSDRLFGSLILPGAERIVSYHIVTQGPCWGSVAGERPVRLESGDILLVPHGDAYVMSSEPRQSSPEDEAPTIEFFRLMAAGELPPLVVEGGPGPVHNRIICGFLGCDVRPYNPVLSALPRMIHLPARAPGTRDPLSQLIDFALVESGQGREGGRCVLLRLSELMFVEVIRRYLVSAPQPQCGWLAGLRDPLVGRALSLLHRRPAFPWTLQTLAREAGTSRSTLAEHFTRLVGEPPMQYHTRWRMQVAAHRLAAGSSKVYGVAQEVGYQSEAAFSRAFKRVVGMSPAQWRQARAGED